MYWWRGSTVYVSGENLVMRVAVIGSGTMGNGIAHSFASSGYKVILHDIKKEFLDIVIATI
jgi:3-hydroxybutyryl-CoA dehydrogenase